MFAIFEDCYSDWSRLFDHAYPRGISKEFQHQKLQGSRFSRSSKYVSFLNVFEKCKCKFSRIQNRHFLFCRKQRPSLTVVPSFKSTWMSTSVNLWDRPKSANVMKVQKMRECQRALYKKDFLGGLAPNLSCLLKGLRTMS